MVWQTPEKQLITHIIIVRCWLNLSLGGTSEVRMSPIAIVLSYVWMKGDERRLVHAQEAPPVLNGSVMPLQHTLQHLVSLGFRYFWLKMCFRVGLTSVKFAKYRWKVDWETG